MPTLEHLIEYQRFIMILVPMALIAIIATPFILGSIARRISEIERTISAGNLIKLDQDAKKRANQP